MSIEQFANSAQTNLAAPLTSSVLTVTVNSSAGFPGSGNFRIRIDNELMLVTAVSGATWTVTRGIESTAAAAHNTGAAVTQVLTAGVMNEVAALASTQSANTVMAGPSSGGAALPGFRALVGADLPSVTNVGSGVTRGDIDGLTLIYNSTNNIQVAVGSARDSTDALSLTLGSAFTKTTGGTFVAGSGSAGLDAGSVAANTWYHVWLIAKADGSAADVLISTSATSPTMPGTYTLKRRLGSFRTNGSSQTTQFVQHGDEFYWMAPVADVAAANPGTSAVTRTLTVPTGVQVRALLVVGFSLNSAATDNPAGVLITDPSLTDTAPSASTNSFICYDVANNFQVPLDCWTNTSAQVRSRLQFSTSGTTLNISTRGWVDQRGKNA